MKNDNLDRLVLEIKSFATVNDKNKTVNVSDRLLESLTEKQNALLLKLKFEFGFCLQYTIE